MRFQNEQSIHASASGGVNRPLNIKHIDAQMQNKTKIEWN